MKIGPTAVRESFRNYHGPKVAMSGDRLVSGPSLSQTEAACQRPGGGGGPPPPRGGDGGTPPEGADCLLNSTNHRSTDRLESISILEVAGSIPAAGRKAGVAQSGERESAQARSLANPSSIGV